jgi:putative addiction module component (TIGR02574 family)
MTADVAGLLKLPARDRARLAMALWQSLGDRERDIELRLSAKQRAEIDRRLAGHAAAPDSAIPWTEVRRRLRARG